MFVNNIKPYVKQLVNLPICVYIVKRTTPENLVCFRNLSVVCTQTMLQYFGQVVEYCISVYTGGRVGDNVFVCVGGRLKILGGGAVLF